MMLKSAQMTEGAFTQRDLDYARAMVVRNAQGDEDLAMILGMLGLEPLELEVVS